MNSQTCSNLYLWLLIAAFAVGVGREFAGDVLWEPKYYFLCLLGAYRDTIM